MSDEVLAAMNEAARCSIDMHELHIAAGKRLAQLTQNEAAYVTSGCAAALVLAVLAIRNNGDPSGIISFPGHAERPFEVVMHTAHRIPYDSALALAGATIRQIGNAQQTFEWELEAAITKETAAVLYVPGTHLAQVALPLDVVVAIAHARGIPVVVDAAAQLPPVENLWSFTRDQGADIAVFSGGKALGGPQASGLMVGRTDLIEAARQNGAPYQRWARALKVGKEEIAGLITAVSRFVSLDHRAVHQDWLKTVQSWHAAFEDTPGVIASIEPTNEAGQPVPRLHLGISNPERARKVLDFIDASNPRVMVLPDMRNGQPHGLWLTPEILKAGEPGNVQNVVLSSIDQSK
ncbi:L-seryl-tRNA(Ser) seleniumtransferase [Alpinimonas psychrophila]|uniref:L-seryl-tRNA(Ser) seleniumtransferase n=2 Tax=Alpinimonas psychrophila TaxID=748908 RepID=A0A7W3JTM3_9MICO|nr:L-seryl-tRNA(Ser) seleniumtransferase [Alpinimonas psychrophila]